MRLVRAINFLPPSGGEKSTDTCTDEAEDWRKYGLSLVAGADDGLRRTIIIDGRASSEASARSDSSTNERVAPAMPGAARGNLLDAGAGKSLVCSVGVDDESVVGDGLELALKGFLVIENDTDLLTRAELFEIVPAGILGAAKRGADQQYREQQSEAKPAHGSKHPESPWGFKNGTDHTPHSALRRSVYRHARATGLLPKRQKNVRTALRFAADGVSGNSTHISSSDPT